MSLPNKLSLPVELWPTDIRCIVEALIEEAPDAQKPRIRQGMGRWLKLAEDEDVAPDFITPKIMAARSATMRVETAQAMRQALLALFPSAPILVAPERTVQRDGREVLACLVERSLARLPATWHVRIGPMLQVGDDEFGDGRLIQAWSWDGLEAVLHSIGWFLDFCRGRGLDCAVSPSTVRAYLDARHADVLEGSISIHTVVAQLGRVLRIARVAEPERNFAWLAAVVEALKKKARLHPTINNSRVVDLVELREAAAQCGALALKRHRAAKGAEERQAALILGRSALGLSLLVNSPIRRGTLALLDLDRHFNAEFTRLYLDATETKDGKDDTRMIGAAVRTQLLGYIELQRASVSPEGERRHFLGVDGAPLMPDRLTATIGDLTERVFERRVTPQVVRNVVASFIVSQAPDEAGLASEVLNHERASTTETYRSDADQITASIALRVHNDVARQASRRK